MSKYSPNKKSRKRLRLKGYDYSTNGYYFVTFCTQNRRHLFGKIIHSKMILNNAGIMVKNYIDNIPKFNDNVIIDTYVIMPDHMHMIIVINNNVGCKISLPDVMRNMKTMTTRCYIKGVIENNWLPFYKKLWQRSYHDIIVRDQFALYNIRKYIINNPVKWNKN